MSLFNPDEFLNATVTGANSTTMKPIPEHEAQGYVKSINARTTTSGKAILDVTWVVDSEEARKATNLAEPTVRQSIFLDICETGLDMSEGKNLGLGRLRAAVGQNEGQWSPNMLVGKVAKLHITQRVDDKDSSRIFNDVKSVAAK